MHEERHCFPRQPRLVGASRVAYKLSDFDGLHLLVKPTGTQL